jgi:hypothetical protein
VNETATTETIPTPERFLEARRLIVGRQKDYIPPEMFQDMDAASGRGDYFTVIGEEIYILGGALDKPYSLLYWREFEAFDADNDTNWLLQNAPGVYLWSSCKEGAEYLKDFEAADRFNSKYLTELAALNASEKAMRHSGSQLRTRVGGSTP